jgi:hypothetical protein
MGSLRNEFVVQAEGILTLQEQAFPLGYSILESGIWIPLSQL